MLEIKELTITCDGQTILDGMSLSVEEKGIFGVLCADDKQKDMLAAVLCGAISPYSGEILYDENLMNRDAIAQKRKVRLASSKLNIPLSMTVFEYLELVGNSLNIDSEKKYRQIKEALELTELDGVKNKIFAKLNASMKCRLSIAAAVLGNPDYIILNEPFSNLDNESVDNIYDLLKMLGSIKTLILISHEPDRVKCLCESVAIINMGRVALCGNINDIEQKINTTHELNITVKGDKDKITEAINDIDDVVATKIISSTLNDVHVISLEHYPNNLIKDKLFNALANINSPMLSIKQIRLTLNDVFYSLSASDTKNNEIQAELPKKKLFTRRKKA